VADLRRHGDWTDLILDVAGRPWTLALDGPRAGLSWSDGRSLVQLLGLRHIATTGRLDERAFDDSSLVSVERLRGRIQATFAPQAWDGLSIRAAWEPTPGHDGFDLEIQAAVSSTRVFRRLEVEIGSCWRETAEDSGRVVAYRVEPRDVHAAALSYDGREPPSVLHALTTMPVPVTVPHSLAPIVVGDSGGIAGRSYAEMVQPNDCARRIIGEIDLGDWQARRVFSIDYGLFGHDLEKGVVLRGRIRGTWLDPRSPDDEINRRHVEFLREPPSLGS
jgi:hypothetical protein